MLLEAILAVLVGMVALLLVLRPLFRPPSSRPEIPEPLDPEETPRGIALTALKEIDFDRETGKLSEADYQFLKAKYTTAALAALRAEETKAEPTERHATCRSCGPRPELDAVFCSTCGLRIGSDATPLPAASPAGGRSAPAVIPAKPLQAG
jgi:hypothetical protein